jgi:hypothetical protein
MTLENIVEVLKLIDDKITPIEIVINLNGYYKDILNKTEHLFEVETITTIEGQAEFLLENGSDTFQDQFMKFHSIVARGNRLAHVTNSIQGDDVFDETHNSILFGTYYNGKIKPFPVGTVVQIMYYSYPEKVTLETKELPLQAVHSLLLWRFKAQLFSEQRQWDRTGYYNRLYEKSLHEYRRMILSSGDKKRININTQI